MPIDVLQNLSCKYAENLQNNIHTTRCHKVISIILCWGYFRFTEIYCIFPAHFFITKHSRFISDWTVISDATLSNSYGSCTNTGKFTLFSVFSKFYCILLNNVSSDFSCHIVTNDMWHHIKLLWLVNARRWSPTLYCSVARCWWMFWATHFVWRWWSTICNKFSQNWLMKSKSVSSCFLVVPVCL